MDAARSPDFSPLAKAYAQSRPGYPAELFAFLAGLAPGRRLAWDCATGNGQAARSLVEHFDRVVATDLSAEQIAQAVPHERIEYRVASAEDSGIAGSTVDLVTVATAIHWFDMAAFGREVRRVLVPGGVLAAWTYHVAYLEPPFEEVFRRFYEDTLKPYFPAGAKLVDDRYETLTLPGEALPTGQWATSVEWTLGRTLAFVESWSGTGKYRKERGADPIAILRKDLDPLWGDPAQARRLSWPVYLRAARLNQS